MEESYCEGMESQEKTSFLKGIPPMTTPKPVYVRDYNRIHHGLQRFVRSHWRGPRTTKNSTHNSNLL